MDIDDQIAERKTEEYELRKEIYNHMKSRGGKYCGNADCKLCATHWDMTREN